MWLLSEFFNRSRLLQNRNRPTLGLFSPVVKPARHTPAATKPLVIQAALDAKPATVLDSERDYFRSESAGHGMDGLGTAFAAHSADRFGLAHSDRY